MQVLASLRVEQQKPEEALQHLRTSMNNWFPSLQRMLADSDSQDSNKQDDAVDGTDDEIMAALPSFEFRFETAKLLIELDETTEAAVQVYLLLQNAYISAKLCIVGLLDCRIHRRIALAEVTSRSMVAENLSCSTPVSMQVCAAACRVLKSALCCTSLLHC